MIDGPKENDAVGAVLVAALGFGLLIGAAEIGARRLDREVGTRRSNGVIQDNSSNENVAAALNSIAPTAGERVLLVGNSQVDKVIDDSTERSTRSVPFRLAERLSGSGRVAEVVDLSGPGQQVVESAAIAIEAAAAVRPAAVVFLVNLFSMQRVEVREGIQSAVGSATALEVLRVASSVPGGEALVETVRLLTVPATRGRTIQERADSLIVSRLAPASALVRNRAVAYRNLIDVPIRRDGVALLQKLLGRAQPATARTFDAGPAVPPSIAAFRAAAYRLRALGTHVLVVVLPYEQTREPRAFTPAGHATSTEALRHAAADAQAAFLDLSGSLGPDAFGRFRDGSPDGLHFNASGHALVADSIAVRLPRRATSLPPRPR